MTALFHSCWYHLGSICVGAAVIPYCRVARVLSHWFDFELDNKTADPNSAKSAKDPPGCCGKFLCCMCGGLKTAVHFCFGNCVCCNHPFVMLFLVFLLILGVTVRNALVLLLIPVMAMLLVCARLLPKSPCCLICPFCSCC